MKRKFLIILATVLASSIMLAACQGQIGGTTGTATPSRISPTPSGPEKILGIQGDASTTTSYPGIPWVRLSYPTCVSSNLSGQVLKDTIRIYHNQGMHVMLTYCQTSGDSLFDTRWVAQAHPGDAWIRRGSGGISLDAKYLFRAESRGCWGYSGRSCCPCRSTGLNLACGQHYTTH